ncbi:hypothetical protein SANTM175S_00235 [Streptomyces antimycoticus]
MVDGFRYIAAHRILLMSFLADIIAMVFGMPRALFPQLASHTYAPWARGSRSACSSRRSRSARWPAVCCPGPSPAPAATV